MLSLIIPESNTARETTHRFTVQPLSHQNYLVFDVHRVINSASAHHPKITESLETIKPRSQKTIISRVIPPSNHTSFDRPNIALLLPPPHAIPPRAAPLRCKSSRTKIKPATV